jgi:beta-galactosidase
MVLVCFYFLVLVFGATTPPEIEDLSVIDQNKLAARTAIWPSPTLESAQTSTFEKNDWLICLNGVWKFAWSPTPTDRQDQFYQPTYDISKFADITVPASAERQGYGTALYTNNRYPFDTSSIPKVFRFRFVKIFL